MRNCTRVQAIVHRPRSIPNPTGRRGGCIIAHRICTLLSGHLNKVLHTYFPSLRSGPKRLLEIQLRNRHPIVVDSPSLSRSDRPAVRVYCSASSGALRAQIGLNAVTRSGRKEDNGTRPGSRAARPSWLRNNTVSRAPYPGAFSRNRTGYQP